MEYMLLIYDRETDWMKLAEKDRGAMFKEYGAFTEGLKKNGNLRSGNALQPVTSATTVRVRDGKTVTTDGPFAETREQLGGYYLIEAKDLDEAISIAARVPSARSGSIEVRPIMAH
jgi:hypothetical protein